MLVIHIYGQLKKKFKPEATMAEDTIINLHNKEKEIFEDLLERLDLKYDECGDCFINGHLATNDFPVPMNARIGLFPFEMRLIDGGQYIK
ncbi:MAG: hypothetical protein ACW964_06690 [Candidatus Hodarchaeales archaeon]|jgi:hypothetical protein